MCMWHHQRVVTPARGLTRRESPTLFKFRPHEEHAQVIDGHALHD